MAQGAVVASALLSLLAAGAKPAVPTLERMASQASSQVLRHPVESPVGVHVEAPTAALANAFSAALAASLNQGKLPATVLAAANREDALKQAHARDLRSLLTVSLTLSNAKLTAQGALVSTWVNFWSGNSSTPTVLMTLSSQDDADLNVLALAAAPPQQHEELKLDTGVLTRLPQVPVAVAAFDIDGDKRAEVAVLMEDALWLLTSDGKPLGTYDLRPLPRSPTPTREPFGVVAFISNPARVVYLSGKTAQGECLVLAGGQLKPTAVVKQVSLDGFFVSLQPGVNALAGDVSFGKSSVMPAAPLSTSSSRGPLTLFVYGDGTGQVVRGVGSASRFRGLGSGAALLDIDGNGQFELLGSSAEHFPAADELKVFSAAAAEALGAKNASLWDSAPLWRGLAAKGRVLTAAGGDLDGDGAEEALLGMWLEDGTGELHFLKRAAK